MKNIYALITILCLGTLSLSGQSIDSLLNEIDSLKNTIATLNLQIDTLKGDTVVAPEVVEIPPKWKVGVGVGLDFSQLLQINPRQGAGQNRIGGGIALNLFGNYTDKRFSWDNSLTYQFGIQRFGSGVIAQGNETQRIPFEKAIDELRLNSTAGYRTGENSKWFYAGDLFFMTSLTPTYLGNEEYPGFFLTDVTGEGRLQSKFFNPATLNLSLGMDYKPNEKFSIYYSPIGVKFIFVPDDNIAALGIHGNPVEGEPDPDTGLYPEFENSFKGLGQTLRLKYANTFLNARLIFTSNLRLFSNYLENPQNIDVDWNNELGFKILEGLTATLTTNIFYDDDVEVFITDFDAVGGVSGTGKRVSFTEQLLLKYTVNF